MLKIKTREKTASMILGYCFTLPSVILMIVLLFIPMAKSIQLSLLNTSLTLPEPEFIGLQGYKQLFRKEVTWIVLRNSFLWTILVAGFQNILGLTTAMILNRGFVGRVVFRTVSIIPWVMPGIIAAMLWRMFGDAQLGFLNAALFKLHMIRQPVDWLGTPNLALAMVIVTAIWKGFGFSMLMYLAALQTVPQEQYESASIDGANGVQRFIYVTIPNIRSVMNTTVLLTAILTFNFFDIIYGMTGGGPLQSTHIAPTYIYEVGFRYFNFGLASRYSVLSFIIVGTASMFYIYTLNKKEKL